MLDEYTTLTARLAPIVRNIDAFKLITFILMFDVDEGELRRVQTRYLTLLRRRLRHLQGDKEDDLYERFVTGMADIKRVGEIIRTILSLGQKEKEEKARQGLAEEATAPMEVSQEVEQAAHRDLMSLDNVPLSFANADFFDVLMESSDN